MAAECVEHVPTGVHGVIDGEALDAPGGAFAEVALVREDDDRAQIALEQFGRDDAEDAFVSAFAADDQDGHMRQFRMVLQVRNGLGE
ncbi:MAG: hypothetical protein IIY38_04570, partial [Clostridia bacterium]|nr:hypothetical protein [Clostridia bacterium]